jgi:ribonuclease J
VPEMNALLVKTKHGNILHSGDWKFDPDPVVGNVSEKEKIKSYGDKGEILALVCDSTNAMSSGHSRSEGELYESLKELVVKQKGRVAIATFASNLARIQTISEVARDCGRKVVLAGFSIRRLMEVGKKSGYFQDLPDVISDQKIGNYKPHEVLVICTGCQGEPLAATMKIATDNHRFIKFAKDDTVIFSSKIIPGNEKSIFGLFNLFAHKQINVITEKDHFVHVSGHPNQDELSEMYSLAQPQVAVPVHGEFVHIREHCKIASDAGTKEVVEVSNGCVVKLSKEGSGAIGFVPTGYFGVDGKQLIPINGDVIKARRKLSNSGIVTTAVVIDSQGALIDGPKIDSLGAYDFQADPAAFEMLEREMARTVNCAAKDLGLHKRKTKIFGNSKSKKAGSHEKIQNAMEKNIRLLLNKFFKDLLGKKPVFQVFVTVID